MSESLDRGLVHAIRLLEEARADLRTAVAVASDPQLPPRIACFLAHLAAEKAIKALLSRQRIATPKIHDLRQLVDRLGGEDIGRFNPSELDEMSRWNIDGRYPGGHADAQPSDAAAITAMAASVLTVVGPLIEAGG
jgi:HEPN domain-containing protein